MGGMFPKTTGLKKDIQWLDLLKVGLTIGIVLRHATLTDMGDTFPVYESVSKGIVELTELCVPLFFAISGYLFFLNIPERPGWRWFGQKLYSRLFSLLIPYLIANALAFLFYWLAQRFLPGLISGFMGESWKDPLYIFWTGPVNLSLWFIRDLLIACLCTPLTYLFLRYTRWWGILALGILWFAGGQRPWTNFFFCTGAALAMFKVDIEERCQAMGPWLVILFFGAFIFNFQHETGLEFVILAGLPLCVWGASFLTRKGIRVGARWRAWAFIIYLYHYTAVIGIKKALCAYGNPVSDLAFIAISLGSAALVLIGLTGLLAVMRKCMPTLTKVLIGGKQA